MTSRESLSPERQELVDLLLKERGQARGARTLIPRGPDADYYPLTFVQQRLWFVEQLQPGTLLYSIPYLLRLSGPLAVGLLKRSLNLLVQRHDQLRTCFREVDNQPVQVLLPAGKVYCPVIDMQQGTALGGEDEQVRILVRAVAEQPFRLSQAPLIHAALLRICSDQHILVLCFHHLIFDGWSLDLLLSELGQVYAALANHRELVLPSQYLRYVDVAVWQRSTRRSDEQLVVAYWKKQLAGSSFCLQIPCDYPRPASQRFQGALQPFVIPDELAHLLRQRAEQEKCTLFMVLLAAFASLLSFQSGEEDLLIGTPVAGRVEREMEQLVGCFVNSLVLRCDLARNPTLSELLQRIREMALQAFTYQELPFERLVEEINPARDFSRSLLFQVAFIFQKPASSVYHLADVQLEVEGIDIGLSKLDLTMTVAESGASLAGSLEYNTELFRPATIQQLLEQFQQLLTFFAQEPGRKLLSLPGAPLRKLQHTEQEGDQPARPAAPSGETLDALFAASNLSRNQLLTWLEQKLQPADPLCNMAYAFTLAAPIDVERFRRAFRVMIAAHDSLRTIIEEVDGIPRQRVRADIPYEMPFVDFSAMTQPFDAAHEWMSQRYRQQFNLASRLFEAALLKISDTCFIWYLNEHHLITDAWSASLLYRRMMERYTTQQEELLPTVYPGFQAYIERDRAYCRSVEYQKAEAYWNEKLQEPCEESSFYEAPAHARGSLVQRVSYDLGWERTGLLQQIMKRSGIGSLSPELSLFTIFTALLFILMYRLNGITHPSIGTAFHNRASQTLKETLGLLMTVNPVRITLQRHDTFLSVLQKTRAEIFETLKHARYAVGNSEQHKAYDVFLNYHNSVYTSFPGVPAQVRWLHPGYGNESLAIQVQSYEGKGSIHLDFDLHCDVFGMEDRQRVIEHFVLLLDAFVADPTQPISRVEFLSEQEKQRIFTEWNPRREEGQSGNSVLSQFEEQVRAYPDQIALVMETEVLTYSLLNVLAERVAGFLQARASGPEVHVGLCMERSPEQIIGILGILKAGGVCLPLDPGWPPERLLHVLQQVQPGLILTQRSLRERLGDRADGGWLCIEEIIEATTAPERRRALILSPESLACVLFTSGTTALPKGVQVRHGSLGSYVQLAGEAFTLMPGDRVLQFATLSFDLAFEEIFCTLARGATLVLRPVDLSSREQFMALCQQQAITVLDLPTAYWHELMSQESPQCSLVEVSTLRLVVIGGEAIQSSCVRQWQAIMGSEVRLVNTYGPSEATIASCMYDVSGIQEEQAYSLLGRPMARSACYLLDKELRLVPIGVIGDLYIAGEGLARGYHAQPDLTAERFLPNPFAEEGARLYRTGDRARYRIDGLLEFLGREDDQIKIRGYRVEPAEVEQVLSQHPAVRNALVVIQDKQMNEKQIIACIIPVSAEHAPAAEELRTFAKARLPAPLLPAAFVLMDAYPLTLHGKVDRRALAALTVESFSLRPWAAPTNATEQTLEQIWKQVLGRESIGIHDDFFELGGHSLLAMRIVSRMRAAFQVEVTLRQLFEMPTIAQLAMLILQQKVAAQSDDVAQLLLEEIERLSEEDVASLRAEEE